MEEKNFIEADMPAPKKDQIKGSSKNKPGSASNKSGSISLSPATKTALQAKVAGHNQSMKNSDKPTWSRASYGALAAVWRRGAGAYSSSYRPGMSRAGWAMARVNAYLYLLRAGRPKNSAYKQDNDLLPASHPRKSGAKAKAQESAIVPTRLIEIADNLYREIKGDEKALVDAMLEIVGKSGKFQSEGSSINAGYDSADKNPNLEIGVKCGNCVFHVGEGEDIECSAIDQDIEEGGACRFAAIPPGLVRVNEAAQSGYKPPAGLQSAAKRALAWIADGKAGDGFTSVGRRRASQLASGQMLTRDTVARMKSYFARHAVDKKATGFNSGEEGYPSPGRVAWDAWGGNAGAAWTKRINLDPKKK